MSRFHHLKIPSAAMTTASKAICTPKNPTGLPTTEAPFDDFIVVFAILPVGVIDPALMTPSDPEAVSKLVPDGIIVGAVAVPESAPTILRPVALVAVVGVVTPLYARDEGSTLPPVEAMVVVGVVMSL